MGSKRVALPILVEPGVASVTTTGAMAMATLQQADADVTLFWDSVDQGVGGTWANSLALGSRSPGSVGGAIDGLAPDTRVFYRLFARNPSTGLEAWTAESSSFATALTGKAVADLTVGLFGTDEVDLEWIGGFGLDPADQDPGDDPDADGLSNLVEGFLGTNPATANPGLGKLPNPPRPSPAAPGRPARMSQLLSGGDRQGSRDSNGPLPPR